VLWITERLSDLWGSGVNWSIDGQENPHEAHYLKLDSSKATARLGWKPKWNLEQALVSIVDWYKAFQKGEDVRDVMMRQIQSYFQLADEALAK
jgi:CDP-glucose 4,6-dehydratase